MKIAKQFYPKENLIRPNYIFPHYIPILFIHTQNYVKNAKSVSQFLKNIFTWGG